MDQIVIRHKGKTISYNRDFVSDLSEEKFSKKFPKFSKKRFELVKIELEKVKKAENKEVEKAKPETETPEKKAEKKPKTESINK